ncbi:RIP metalloprotease RseP [Candidatus Peregrinibacteria bacterium CG_4_10_14_0_2_um_filter_43_11]|nr:MAG: RIP metalloprotease RseP [Candidatus Peregrinibacteria bacterium CG_4_10_14_0_2_um_filter_43_11]
MIFITIIAFIVIFSFLILVHEWGHFIMARRAGIEVEEFGIGLPPRAKAFYKDKKGTVYSLNWIPFGGYVRLYGQDSADPKLLKSKKSFASKTILQRSAVIVAGVAMNFIFAWLLISIGFMIGMKPFLVTSEDVQRAAEQGIVETQHVLYIHEVTSGSPAEAAHIQTGDLITKINQDPAPLAEGLGGTINKGKENTVSVLRKGEELSFTVIPDKEGHVGFSISDEKYIKEVNTVKYSPLVAPLKAAKEVGRLSILTVQMFGKVIVSIISKFAVPEGVAGPIGIAHMTYSFVQQGFMAVLQFTALISISLGVINIMPFPALDGGRLLFIIFEIVLRRNPNAKWEGIIHTIGFALLMALILIVTWNDILTLIK